MYVIVLKITLYIKDTVHASTTDIRKYIKGHDKACLDGFWYHSKIKLEEQRGN